MTGANTNAVKKMETNNTGNNNGARSGGVDLVGGRDGMDESVGGRSISEILGVSGPNGADGTNRPTSGLGRKEVELLRKKGEGSSLQAAITVKVEKGEEMASNNNEMDTTNSDEGKTINHAIRGKRGIDPTGTWQDEDGAFHIEELTERQKRIINARREAGDEVYIDEHGNIEPEVKEMEFNFNEDNNELEEMQGSGSVETIEEEGEEEKQQEVITLEPTPAEALQKEKEKRMARNKAVLEAAKRKEEERIARRDLNLKTNSTSAGFVNAATLLNEKKDKDTNAIKNGKGGVTPVLKQTVLAQNIAGNQTSLSAPLGENNNKGRGAISFTEATKGMNQPMAVYKYETRHRVEISFKLEGIPKVNPTPDQQAAGLKEVLKAILARMKYIVHKGAIMPWKTGDRLKAIERTEDIPENLENIRRYLRHEDERAGRPFKKPFKYGRNTKWRLNLNFNKAKGEEFIHYWNDSKKQYNTRAFVVMKSSPMQAENYWALGFFMNSSEKQLTNTLVTGLQKELGWRIAVTNHDVPVGYSTVDGIWKEAKKLAGDDFKAMYRNAPQALTVYSMATDANRRSQMVYQLQQKYGKHDELGRYPQLPDGSRMRFVPAENRAPMMDRPKIKKLVETQVALKSKAVDMDFPFNIDLNQTFKDERTQKKSMGRLILELEATDSKYRQEPIFRHFTWTWHKEYNQYGRGVSIHPPMLSLAIQTLKALPELMAQLYGQEVASALRPAELKYANQFAAMEEDEGNVTGWRIDDYDRYGTDGGGRFVITGMQDVGMNDTHMEGADMGRDIEVGSIGILSAVTGGTFTSEERNENNIQKEQTEKEDDLEMSILASLMVQYGVTGVEHVRKLKNDYLVHIANKQLPEEVKTLPMQQQLYLFMTKRDEEQINARRQNQNNQQQGNQPQKNDSEQPQHQHSHEQQDNQQNQESGINNQPEDESDRPTTIQEQEEARESYRLHIEEQKRKKIEEERRYREYMNKVDDDIARSQKNYLERSQGYETPRASPHRNNTGYISGPQGRGHSGGRGNYSDNSGRGQGNNQGGQRGQVTPEHGNQQSQGADNDAPWQIVGRAEKEKELAKRVGQLQGQPSGAPGGVI